MYHHNFKLLKKKKFIFLRKVWNKNTEKVSLKFDKVSLKRVWDIFEEQIPVDCGIFHYVAKCFMQAENFVSTV